jgi:putative transposase
VLTGRKYRLAFTPEQAEFADTIGTICRSVWNTALEQRREYRRRGVWMNYVAIGWRTRRREDRARMAEGRPVARVTADPHGPGPPCREHGTFTVR